MLFAARDLQLIAEGRVSVAFRRWVRPTVKAGGTLRTAIGVLAIEAVEPVAEARITASDALAAGFADLVALRAALNRRTEGTVYRVRLRLHGADPRIDLRSQAALSARDVDDLTTRLDRLDAHSTHGPWTEIALRTIGAQPGCRAADLAQQLGRDKDWLKTHIRKLKELGLTESLEVGYRLSPRGQALLSHRRRERA